jgi:hypothetical protein
VYDITNYEITKGYGMMANSIIQENKSNDISATITGQDKTVYTDNYSLTYLQPEVSRTINYWSFSALNNYITQYIVYGNASKTTQVKINANPGIYVNNQMVYVNNKSGTIYTCGKSGIEIEKGSLELGAATDYSINLEVRDQGLIKINSTGSLIVNNGSSLIVKSGGTLHVKSGATLIVNAGGQLLVEAGGYVCIESGAILTNVNLITVSGTANIGTNPILGITSSNCINNFCSYSAVTNANALKFDGINDGVEITNNTILNLSTTPFTVEAYIKSNKTNAVSHQVILSKRNTSTEDGFMFGIWQNGNLWIQLKGAPNIGIDGTSNLLDGKCHHVAISRNSSNLLKFYIDGALTFQTTVAARDINSTGNLRIGRDVFSGLYFDGYIGEIRVWNTERTLIQLQTSINQTLSAQTNLVALWDMKGYNQVLTDISGKVNTGTLGTTSNCENSDPLWVATSEVNCNAGAYFKANNEDDNLPWILLPNLTDSNQFAPALVVQVFPNPFSNQINVKFTGAINEVLTFEVKNMAGQIVYSQTNCTRDKILTFGDDLPAAIYLLQIQDGSELRTFKIVKTN